MTAGETDPTEIIRKLAESYRGIKFGMGVVGKTSYATLSIIGLWVVILFRASENLILDAVLFGGGLIATAAYFWWVHGTQKFARENPGLALMEGAQLLEYQKWEAAIKGQPTPTSPLVPNPYIDVQIESENEE